MCSHPNILIFPTEENSWGIEDTYLVKCTCCHKIILDFASENKVENFLAQQNYHCVYENLYEKCYPNSNG